jgi:transposase
MENTHAPILGIDVSKKKLDAALLDGGKLKNKVVENNKAGYAELAHWVAKQKVDVTSVHACMESTGIYSEPVAIKLQAMGMKVSIVNPGCIKGFAQSENIRNKNDKVDAGVIARYCRAMTPEPWVAPPPGQRLLRGWVERLSALQDIRQQEANRIEAHEFAEQTDLAKHAKEHVDWLDTQIAQLKRDIDQHIDSDPGLRSDVDLMTTIPGVGRATAAKVISYAGDVRRFDSAKAFAAFVGVTPKQRQSGSSVRGRTMISRIGSSQLRASLYLPGVVAKTHNPILRAFAARLSDNGLCKMAVVSAVMRKLAHLIYGVMRSGKPFDANYLHSGLAVQDGI